MQGDLPRRHGDLEREFKDNVAEFSIPEYRNSKFRNGFLEKYHEKKGLKKTFPDLAEEALSKYSPGFLQETVAFVLASCTHEGEINATVVFFSP